MKELIKVLIIYAILLIITSVLDGYFSTENLYYLKIFIVQTVVMITLFKVLKVESKSIIIFLGIMAILITLVALDSNVLFGKYADVGLCMENYIVPMEIVTIAALISKPFCVIFGVLEDFNVVQKSMYIIPLYMTLITYVSVKILKLNLIRKREN